MDEYDATHQQDILLYIVQRWADCLGARLAVYSYDHGFGEKKSNRYADQKLDEIQKWRIDSRTSSICPAAHRNAEER